MKRTARSVSHPHEAPNHCATDSVNTHAVATLGFSDIYRVVRIISSSRRTRIENSGIWVQCGTGVEGMLRFRSLSHPVTRPRGPYDQGYAAAHSSHLGTASSKVSYSQAVGKRDGMTGSPYVVRG